MAWPEKELDNEQSALFEQLIKQRANGTPVAYLTGEKEFWSLTFNVSSDTLIPRPETELLVETVLSHFQNSTALTLADMGTGSGAIAIAIASEQPEWNITATDRSPGALEVARSNAKKHQIKKINFIESNWFDAMLDLCFDVIVSNPPYIASDDAHLSSGDVRFEPQTALISGLIGMDDIIQISSRCKQHLNENGWLVFEHGYDQKEAVFECLKDYGFCNIIQLDDLSGNPRVSMGQWCGDEIV